MYKINIPLNVPFIIDFILQDIKVIVIDCLINKVGHYETYKYYL